MPAMKICNHPGCRRAIDASERYCEQHKQLHIHREETYTRPERHAFYGTGQWRRIRNAYIRRHPLCEECIRQGRVTQAVIVDHVIEIKDGGSKTDMNNLQSLCRFCHAEKTENEKRKRNASRKTGETGGD